VRDTIQEVVFGVTGQTLYLDAPEGVPSAVTSVTVVRSDGDDASSSESALGSPSVSSVTTTLSAAAGTSETDTKAVPLTSATGFVVNRPYLLTATTNETAWVVFAAISGSTGYARTPLTSSFASGSTIASPRISATVDATWVATASKLSDESGLDRMQTDAWRAGDNDEDPRYRAIWLYTVAGIVRRRETRFDLVRYTAQHAITPVDVDERFPGWLDRVPNDYRRDQGQSLIDEAFRAVKFDLLADGHATRWIRRQDVIGELVVCKAQVQAAELAVMHGALQVEALKTAEAAYETRLTQLIRGPNLKIGSTPGGSIAGGRERAPLGRR
jgi:hypothetical protein